MPYDTREPYTRRYEEDDEERFSRGRDHPRTEAGRPYSEPSRMDYGSREYSGREYDREREFESPGRNPYRLGYSERPAFSGWETGARESAILVRLSDTDFDIPDRDDLRGRTVIDQRGNDIGNVDDLIVDQQQRRVRFLQVTSGGFLGFGGTMMLIPVEAITRVTSRIVAIDEKSIRGFRSAAYNPSLIDERERDDYARRGWNYGSYTGAGQHKGRGPRGYRRSDERIREDINDRLSDRGDLDASDVEVTVVSCEVTLSGEVNSRREKRLAEDIAENVLGVQNVENRLKVRQLASRTATDRSDALTPPATTERPIADTATDAAKASR